MTSVAVLSLTRDRLWATQHCFQRLHELAGCDFTHYVYDQGSADGTPQWLEDEYQPDFLWRNAVNVGISKALNFLLGYVLKDGGFDVVVKFDNDCELVTPGALKACAELAKDGGWITSPHIQGLNQPPGIEREESVLTVTATSDRFTFQRYRVGVPSTMGGIFMAAPASLYQTYKHDPANPIWGLDDARLVDYWRASGGEVGYLLDYTANHYLGTDGQAARDPAWFARKLAEYQGAA